jgi:alkanesulfonate monooxygenase SsuD/methylene tetrahydromethanopterin reductase-like flavin-dependent oxidoreductase (luciferase family)
MRFGLLMLPTVPGTLEERERLRPIAAHNERWQMMLKEIVEFARMAEDLGVEMVAFPEHHLHTEDEHQSSARRADRLRAAGMEPAQAGH